MDEGTVRGSLGDSFEGWAILEVMGHRRMGGMVQEVQLAGAGFLRIDIPTIGDTITQFYPPSSIYCLTPTTEAMARAVALANQQQPVSRWELPAMDVDARRVAAADIRAGSPVGVSDDDLARAFADDDFDEEETPGMNNADLVEAERQALAALGREMVHTEARLDSLVMKLKTATTEVESLSLRLARDSVPLADCDDGESF